ncbi:MAG: PSD1 domain-containing protein [Phycisphaeraceae bacterium]|nr:PSD1 domain-containing protein [Phycisphaeraceae bacterium]
MVAAAMAGAAFLLVGVAGWVALAGAGSAPAAQVMFAGQSEHEEPVRYARDIRRLLSDRCFQCHGPDAAARQADLRLDDPASAYAARPDGAAIVPGNPNASELWKRITTTDPVLAMPPPEANKRPLSDDEKAQIRAWIEQGAEYEPHWSFVPPSRPALPTVRNTAWPRDRIDRLVLANMESRGVAPSPEADRATLLRRVFLDLTGLPPTIDEIDEFLADTSENAYEAWVDRIFTQEPYRTRLAERLAVPWLDAARYGDTCGIHTDNGRQIWPWRDWVLRALRDNMPYDRFLTEQLAGDLLPEPTIDQLVATGFNRNHVTTDEGGAIDEEYLVEYAADRANTTASVFLGLTFSCARCHDHKFDPISQEDYFSFFAFFNSNEEPGLYSQTADSRRAYEPFMAVPTAEDKARLDVLDSGIRAALAQMEAAAPDEADQRSRSLAELVVSAGASWISPRIVDARSIDPRVRLEPQPDGSIIAAGGVPAIDEYVVTLRTEARGLRLLALEAMVPDGDPGKPAGRSANGNAVLTGVRIETGAPAGGTGSEVSWRTVPLRWAWADHSQADGNHDVTNVLNATGEGWAIAGHQQPGKRLLLILTDEPFGAPAGEDGGTEAAVRVTLSFRSRYQQHSLARFRLNLGTIDEQWLTNLPAAPGRLHVAGPFAAPKAELFDRAFGPESGEVAESRRFGEVDNAPRWAFDRKLVDGAPIALGDGVNVFYVGRTIWSPTARQFEVSLGSDDGFRLFVNGVEAASRNIERGVAPDQDKATIALQPGPNAVVLKIVNTGGASGYYYNASPAPGELPHDLVAAVAPPGAMSDPLSTRLAQAWRRTFLPSYREAEARLAELRAERTRIENTLPRTMIMKELATPRPAFVLNRGVYDQPDPSRPVSRSVPRALGALPAEAPRNRLGLAQWLVTPENPLTARVAVNRFWEMLFGTGLVRTSEDFGLQGEWPSHPELLDDLAIDFRESGWDVHALLRRIVTSATYRQSSRIRPELGEIDPDNQLLAFYPRRRLAAEQVRDLALFASGLLVEKLGGPSVNPYQPEGLWQEVAMPASNTRIFVRGEGEDLWRRSLYTYWKRASPPPAMLMFDAPTRESCVIRRPSTNTPLQALVTWNDEQFVEAARVLAERALALPGDDESRLAAMMRLCTGREPDQQERAMLRASLAHFRERFAAAPADVGQLVSVGSRRADPAVPWSELAPWTLIANAVLNLHETVTQD